MKKNYKLGRRQFLAASAPAGAGLLSAGCRREGASGGAGNFPETPEYDFVFVNHAMNSPFFSPTRYGIEDAQALLRTRSRWTGSETSDVREMVDAMNMAVSSNVDGIAVSVIDPHAFNDPIQQALNKDIPVIAYNANGDGPGTNPALAYVGQDLYGSGQQMGRRIVDLVGEGLVALFIGTPGQLNVQPRIEGVKQAIGSSGANIEVEQINSGARQAEELSRIDAFYQDHRDLAGMFAVDAGSTQGVAQVMERYGLREKGVRGGGYDLLPKTLELLEGGHIDFTIDQQPYLQGFYPVIQLYIYKVSNGLTGPAGTDTGLLFVDREDAGRYLNTESRFEGDSEQQKVPGES
jgi:simple sugar transport system substrate-binding protein